MLSNKIRTTIVASTAVAALAATAGPASAAVLVRPVGTVTQTQFIKPTTTTTAKEAGSAGVKGYDNEKCERVQQEYNNASYSQIHFTANGNFVLGSYYGEVANQKNQELTENCLVVD